MAGMAVFVLAMSDRTPMAQSSTEGERFLAEAVNTDSGRSTQVEIAVDRWSTEAERSELVTTLREKGADKLDLHYAHHELPKAASAWWWRPIAPSAAGKPPTSPGRLIIRLRWSNYG
jgi:hypothetical protein